MDKINFQDLPSTNTPIDASNMNLLQTNVENGIADAGVVVSVTEPTGSAKKKVWLQHKAEQLITTDRTETINGLTVVRSSSGTITINGTASSNSFIAIKGTGDEYQYNTNLNYKLSGCPANGDYTNTYALYSDLGDVQGDYQKVSDEGNGVIFKPRFTYGTIYIVVRKNYVANNLVFTPKIIASGKEYILDDNNIYNEFNLNKSQILWTNPSPNSNMAHDTLINLLNSEYDLLEVFYKYTTSNNNVWSKRFIKGYNAYLDISVPYYTSSNMVANEYRTLTRQSDTQYKISKCYIIHTDNTRVEREDFIIPLYIVGYKTNLFD